MKKYGPSIGEMRTWGKGSQSVGQKRVIASPFYELNYIRRLALEELALLKCERGGSVSSCRGGCFGVIMFEKKNTKRLSRKREKKKKVLKGRGGDRGIRKTISLTLKKKMEEITRPRS